MQAGTPAVPVPEYQTSTNTNAGISGGRSWEMHVMRPTIGCRRLRVRFASVAAASFLDFEALSCRRAFSRRLLSVALIEPVHASSSVDELLFSGKERVACGANFYVQIALFG